jgi:hypothetical protein
MWSIEAYNAARSHRNRAEEVVGHATGAALVHTGVKKGLNFFLPLWLGSMQGYGGEPTIGGSPTDPTSGTGLKAAMFIVGNAIEMLQLLFGVHLAKYGLLGVAGDAAIESVADVGMITWAYDFGVTAGSAKRKKEGGAAAAGRFNYDRRAAALNAPNPAAQAAAAGVAGANVASGVRAVVGDPLAGYR